MTPRFKVALAVLGALVLATGALWIALGDLGGKGKRPPKPPTATAGREAPTLEPEDLRTAEGPDPTLSGQSGGTDGGEPDATGRLHPGIRTPSGEDLSDPKVVKALLAQHLAEEVVDWAAVKQLVAVLKEPLDPHMRERFIEELRTGNRVGVVDAFGALQDGSLVPDLLTMIDEPGLPTQARAAVLLALQQMPGADRDEVVRGLEARMTGDQRWDLQVLQAIAVRGGREATRALVDYVKGGEQGRRMPSWVLQRLDLRRDPEGAEVLAGALRTEQSPETLRTLVDMAGRPGAQALVEPLIALNRDGVSEDIRQQVIVSLGRVGNETAVSHLLGLAQQPGVYGDVARRAVGSMTDATPASLDLLTSALLTADRTAQPDQNRSNLLLALGTLRHKAALPHMGDALKDRSTEVKIAAVRGLGRLGAASRAYVSSLVSLYSSGDDTMRRHVVIALGSVGGPEARNALAQMKGDPKLSPSMQRTVDVALNQAVSSSEDAPVPEGATGPTLGGK
jgi:HEAT repeat protein